jgi:uncharacterized membrane protein
MSDGELSPAPGVPAAKGSLRGMQEHVGALLHRRVARNLNVLEAEQRQSVGERAADLMARAAGSWRFIISFLVVLAAWMVVNAVAGIRHWDPYPFILLNLALSCVAAIQAPIILMSQNREETRDRIRAEADYEVNVKAEVLLENLTREVAALKALLVGGGEEPDAQGPGQTGML